MTNIKLKNYYCKDEKQIKGERVRNFITKYKIKNI